MRLKEALVGIGHDLVQGPVRRLQVGCMCQGQRGVKAIEMRTAGCTVRLEGLRRSPTSGRKGEEKGGLRGAPATPRRGLRFVGRSTDTPTATRGDQKRRRQQKHQSPDEGTCSSPCRTGRSAASRPQHALRECTLAHAKHSSRSPLSPQASLRSAPLLAKAPPRRTCHPRPRPCSAAACNDGDSKL